jgi:hypothetical protein
METTRKTYRILFYALLLAVYAIFFSVQSFFNFEGLSGSQDVFNYYSFLSSGSKTAAIAKARPLHSSTGHHNSRLNKRFHQENMPPCDVISIVIPERYIPVQSPDYSRHDFLPSVTRVSHRLRGPPAVA